MKTAREALMEHFAKTEEIGQRQKQRQILIVGEDLFQRLVKEGYDVTGIHRFEARELRMKSPAVQGLGAGPRNRWGMLA